MVKNTLESYDSTVPKRAVIWKAVSSERQTHEDKASLPEQERLAREWCDEHGYSIVRVLEVDGYSRRESDIVTLLEDYDKLGIYAYHDLRRMWMNKDFDILVAYSHDRLARSNTLHSWVIENIIKNGMNIYLLADGGFVTEEDYRYKLAIGGMMAATPIDKFIKAASATKDKRISLGLPTGSQVPFSHRLIRDPQSGKALYMELNPEHEQLFEDLAMLFLEGVAYNRLTTELYERFGYTDKYGKPYDFNTFHYLFFTPTFWGHMARRYTGGSVNGNMRGAWVFDVSVEPPTGVLVARDVCPSVYTGEIAANVIAEIYRRMEVGGKHKPSDTYRFAGLFVCGECGSTLIVQSRARKRTGLKCCAKYSMTYPKPCGQSTLIKQAYLQAQMENLLKQLIAGASPDIFTPRHEESYAPLEKLKGLKLRRDKLKEQVLVLIHEQSNAPQAVQDLYRQQIIALSTQLESVEETISTIERQIEADEYMSREEIRTLEELKQLTLDCFWRLPDREINQWLRRLMGKRKFVVMDREIVDVVELPSKKRNSGKKKQD